MSFDLQLRFSIPSIDFTMELFETRKTRAVVDGINLFCTGGRGLCCSLSCTLSPKILLFLSLSACLAWLIFPLTFRIHFDPPSCECIPSLWTASGCFIWHRIFWPRDYASGSHRPAHAIFMGLLSKKKKKKTKTTEFLEEMASMNRESPLWQSSSFYEQKMADRKTTICLNITQHEEVHENDIDWKHYSTTYNNFISLIKIL